MIHERMTVALLQILALAGLAQGSKLWYKSPAAYWTSYSLPIGNGRLAASTFGGVADDVQTLNLDSLWTGGPFASASYNGGNPATSKFSEMEKLQQVIWANGTGDATAILGDDSNYGSYTVLGNMTVGLDLDGGDTTGYQRELDLDTAVASSKFTTAKGTEIRREAFCSFPAQACFYHLESDKALPAVTVAVGNKLRTGWNATATGNELKFRGRLEHGIDGEGMLYELRAALVAPGKKSGSYATSNGTLVVPASAKVKELWVVWTADSNYNLYAGNPADEYSFKGPDPAAAVAKTLAALKSKQYTTLKKAHIADHSALQSAQSLTLPDPLGSKDRPTDEVIHAYTTGDPFLESLMFDYSKYLLIASSRSNSLPPNLQGKWAAGIGNPWGADYHTNINLQMPIWGAEACGLGDTLGGYWSYMAESWLPRGAETAKLVYGADAGWVVHNEANIFGHTGLKGAGSGASAAIWALYPAAGAWMMQHVWDRFSYSLDTHWYTTVAFPLLSATAEFHLATLLPDEYTNDGTLVANPCNSPEQAPTTFGCAINQQQVYELFTNILKAPAVSAALNTRLRAALSKLDPGVRIGRYGQIQEWKLDRDDPSDQHRHLSHLYGHYPGYTIASRAARNATLAAAVATTLQHRGLGKWTDANAGWSKLWRAASWGALGNASMAHTELAFALRENFAENLFSVYDKSEATRAEWIFQADANWAWKGAVTAMLVRDLDWGLEEVGGWNGGVEKERTVGVAWAVPESWWGLRVEGVRIRGGGMVSFGVDEGGKVVGFSKKGIKKGVRFVGPDGVVL
ncbi:glycosyl hydrolase family 65, N-terminal domain-containing protein [Geopyxis carbonaria]|nr:glycosyl hydrolase family 65, N-terminal domain-containing protein [Geopyxis carbonaria]